MLCTCGTQQSGIPKRPLRPDPRCLRRVTFCLHIFMTAFLIGCPPRLANNLGISRELFCPHPALGIFSIESAFVSLQQSVTSCQAVYLGELDGGGIMMNECNDTPSLASLI